MMAKYNEREAAVTVIKDYGKGAISDGMKALDPVDDIVALANAMEWIPTADVEPVVHGEWLEDEHTYPGAGLRNNLCSVCGKIAGSWRTGLERGRKWPYCPNCGAKMDGGDDN